MPEYEEYDNMGLSELRAALDEQQRLLADMEEQLTFLLRSTGHHIGGTYRKKRAAEVDQQRALVAMLLARLDLPPTWNRVNRSDAISNKKAPVAENR
jgi:hypothetical protein